MPKSYRFLLFITYLTVLLIVSPTARADAKMPNDLYNELFDLPSAQLYERAQTYSNQNHNDSALVCYTILGSRLDKSKDSDMRLLCIKSYASMAYIYFFNYYNYSRAMEYIIKAQEMADKWGLQVPEVPLYLGLFYCSLGQQSSDLNAVKTSMQYLRKGFHIASIQHNMHLINMAYSNLLSQAYTLGITDSIANESKVYQNIVSKQKNADNYYSNFNTAIYNGLVAIDNRDYKSALKHFQDIYDELPDQKMYSRYRCGTLDFMGAAYAAAGDYNNALKLTQQAMEIADANDLKDAKVELFREMTAYADSLGRNDLKYEYQNRYLLIKDSLLNYQQVAGINEAKFMSEINKVEQQMNTIKEERERLQLILTIGGVLLTVILVMLYLLHRKHRQQKQLNAALFRKNEEMMQAEAQERALRNKYESELNEINARISQAVSETPDSPTEQERKYSGSTLTDAEKTVLAERIRKVLETSNEIYTPDFSLNRLAELVRSKYKYVSQTINETFGCNFNILLNNYRVREACKRIVDDEKYGNLTIEYISQSVGFKSRTTFISQFKRVTGLTPLQYQAQAHLNTK